MMLNSKFPKMEMTIFSQISQMAKEYNAINLGQGFPDFSPNDYLVERIKYYIDHGVNQYSPMQGMQRLRESIKNLHQKLYNINLNTESEITITSGATEAIFCAISSIINEGEEVIIFDPSYDSYVPNIELNKGVPIRLNLNNDFKVDWEIVKKNINEKTKCIILNTPHNPSGSILSKDDLDILWGLIKEKNIFIISDEVYQHIIFDGKKHISPFNDSRFKDRTFCISSFGKSFHVTGWKIGYCLANEELTKEFRKIHQYTTFCTIGNAQLALADMLDNKLELLINLSGFYEKKRDIFRKSLKNSRFKILSTEGSYFQLVDYSEIDSCDDIEFCKKLIKDHSIAAIPISVFYKNSPSQKIIRFCFAKDDQTLISIKNKFINI